MARTTGEQLKVRKTPHQARAHATVDAIFEATVQVLLSDGLAHLTTTRVAERAGVSVGTMYQYFPQKHSLLFALLQRHMDAISDEVAAACARCHGETIEIISDTLVDAFLDAKTRDVEAARALHVVAVELDTDDLVGEFARRNQATIRELLNSASNASFDDPEAIALTLRATLAGMARAMMRRGTTGPDLNTLRRELQSMCRAYLIARAIFAKVEG
ncbi:MAG TPA: TetR/AcrR family transcriptional regulator [Parvibaculum sp.]|jgi:AcrR family transcriptional regulator